ncbi:MAG: hypothetical protein KGN34_05255 [Sphingomonadales bacterium]|nr:hypothetical protein [Sphingomonadales bacterium]
MYLQSTAPGGAARGLPLNLPQSGDRNYSRLAGWASGLVSLALLVMVAYRLRETPLGLVREMIPASGQFWVVFAAYYLAGPLSEWVIYRRLWGLPFSGMAALMRKMVSNELLLGYLGEVQFYAWARSRLQLANTPFGAIKDVAVLSALTGNFATLGMLALAWPLVASGAIGVEGRTAFISLGVVLVSSLAILLLRRKLFSLPRADLLFITGVHFLRILAVVALAALMWHTILPLVSLGLWFVLATLRMLVSRLPLLPNKDVVFAGLAVFLMGSEVQVAGLMAMMAAILLVVHIAVGTAFAAGELASSWRSK